MYFSLTFGFKWLFTKDIERVSVKVVYVTKMQYQDTENTQAFAKYDEIFSYNSKVKGSLYGPSKR